MAIDSDALFFPYAQEGLQPPPRGLMRAIDRRLRVTLNYLDGTGARTRRTVRPLGVLPGGSTGLLAAWCELRGDFRTFRLDRIAGLRTGSRFPPEPGRTLTDYLGVV